MDHRILAGSLLALSTGIAAYSSFKLWSLKRRHRRNHNNVYETQKSLHEYLVFHYGQKNEVLRYDFGPQDALDFPKRCADMCMQYFKQKDGVPSVALDVGCAVGRSTFELCRLFDEVVGIDYSQSFVDACNLLKDEGKMAYYMTTEGNLRETLEAKVDSAVDRQRAQFMQGDACNLPLDLGQFGCVLAANLIDRLRTPQNFLNRLGTLVAPGGILVITSPYTFLEEFTPKDKWIGGYISKKTGKQVTGFDGLKQNLQKHFDLVHTRNMPFLIRETARKHQWTVAHVTVWCRR
ncbi:hypothetical protein LSAT2_030701 [Lamellibrachia satsuma]|nr:hypothetical protein LSAT2_030701 [Lamellibrachia satsuma]